MKIVSALSLLVAGVSAARELTYGIGGDDRYHVHKNLLLGYAGVTPETLEEVFEFEAVHRLADTNNPGDPWVGHRYAYVFRTCPHGKAEKLRAAGDENYLGQIEDNDLAMGTIGYANDQPAWLKTFLPFATTPVGGTEYSTIWHFQVLPTIAEADLGYFGPNPVYTAIEDSGGRSIGGAADFCIFFGIGDAGTAGHEIFGFREITVHAEFSFEGEFTVTTFETQAYNPQTGQVSTSKTWITVARNCSPYPLPDTDIDPAELQRVKPGMPVCIEICPEPNDGNVYIEYVNSLYMEQLNPDDTSAPDGGIPSSPADPGEIVFNMGVYPTTTITCDAGWDGDGVWANGNPDTMGQAIENYCCNVLFVLPARYFPTDGSIDEPDRSTFKVFGDVNVLPVAGPARRLGEKTRALQTEGAEKAPITGQATWDLVAEDYEESSAVSAAAGVAAAAALGAALLL